MRSLVAALCAVLLSGCTALAGTAPLLDVEIVGRSGGRSLDRYLLAAVEIRKNLAGDSGGTGMLKS